MTQHSEDIHAVVEDTSNEVHLVPVTAEAQTLAASPTVVEDALRPLPQPMSVQVTGSADDEYHPTLASSGSTYLVGYTLAPSIMERNIALALSVDGGETFETAGLFEIDGVEDYPSFSHWGGSQYYGTFTTISEPGIQYMLDVGDAQDPETWALFYYDWSSYEWTNIESLDVACHDSQEAWEYGVMSAVASTTYGDYDITNGPHMFFMDPEAEGTEYISWHDMSGCNHSAATIDEVSDRFWCVYDIYNESMGSWDLFWWSRDFSDPLADGASTAAMVQENFNIRNPSVAARDGNIAILCQTDEVGNQDVSCLYSSDGGDTWEMADVAATADAELYPDVALSGDTLVATYVKDGNLYYTSSDDWGATWSEPEQLNEEDGTVLSEYGTAATTPVGAIWSDTRNGNSDVFYGPFPVPVIGVDSMSGGFGAKATISNTGSAEAENVAWTIELDGLVFLGATAEGTIDSLAAGGSTEVSTGLVLGIGPSDITVTAAGASATASGFVIGPFVVGLE
ncbi:MAG: exo-alpha-sialidase [Thermoplasmatota archaeon]